MIGDLSARMNTNLSSLVFTLTIVAAANVSLAQETVKPADADPVITSLVESISARREATWQMAQKIWLAAEPGYQETLSSAVLADAAEAAGLRVTRGVADIPTAFTAEFGSGKPVIGILGEFDALPGLSQQAEPSRLPREDSNTYGHGCGHHLFGTASLSATICDCRADQGGDSQRHRKVLRLPGRRRRQCKSFHGSGRTVLGLRRCSALASVEQERRGRSFEPCQDRG